VFSGSTEDAEHLGRLVARAAEPVRHSGVERGYLTGSQQVVAIAEHQAQVAGKVVQPLVAVV
jgi:hypothetical protein